MDPANPPQDTVAKSITIKNIELRTQKRRKSPLARQFYVKFSVGDASRSTDTSKESKNRTSWEQSLCFDGNDRAILHLQVYQKHHFGKNELVGSFSDTTGVITGKLKENAFEAPLDTPDGSDLTGMTIKFALTAEPLNDDAEERQARYAVARANAAIGSGLTPAVVDPLGSVVDRGPEVVAAVKAFPSTCDNLLRRVKLFNDIVTGIAQVHPYASLAWSVVSPVIKVVVAQKDRDDQVVRLVGTMSDVFAFVEDAEPLKKIEKHAKIITTLIQQVTECGYFITEYTKPNFLMRTAESATSDAGKRIADYEKKLQELKTAFLEGIALQTGITVFRTMNVVEHIAEAIELSEMPYAFGARYAREKGCLPGTRESLLGEISNILNNLDDGAPRVCLLTGVAGSGKSAVAHSIARLYDGQERLGSSYCFTRSDAASRNAKNLFSTIARDLCDHDPQYKAALLKVVKNDRALRASTSPSEQLDKFIVEPSQYLDSVGPLVVVIDALDECGDEASREQLLRAISQQIIDDNLPSNIRFLITTRPESDILAVLAPGSQIIHKQMSDIRDDVVNSDIEKFIHLSLSQYTELESSWPDQEWCRLLVDQSQHLFQWASTACNFIKGRRAAGLERCERFRRLLQIGNTDGVESLDQLYRTILEQLFVYPDVRARFRNVMALVLSLKEPLSIASLSTLFGKELDVRPIIEPMGSLLDGVLEEEKPIRPLHTSFRDFLLDPARSSVFHVSIEPQHSLCVGQALLACMWGMLRFNICDLEDSRKYNKDVPDLPSRISKAIPPHLSYACQYWMFHLQSAECTPALLDEVTTFFKTIFPYWLEAISLLSYVFSLSPLLSAIETCNILNKWAKGQEIAMLASEATQFIQVFAPVLKESTPHLYLSAMPQAPSSSVLCKLWVEHLQKHASITSGNLAKRLLSLLPSGTPTGTPKV